MNVKEENYRKRMFLGQDGNALVQLLVLNAVIFVVLKFVFVFFLATDNTKPSFIEHVFNWFTLSANPEKIIWRPWTLISFMFTDQDLFRFISNMFWLWSFGYILQDLTGNNKLIPIYLYGGIGGAIIYVLVHVVCSRFSGSGRYRFIVWRELLDCRRCRCCDHDLAGIPNLPHDQRRHSLMDPCTHFYASQFLRRRDRRSGYCICLMPGAAGMGFLFMDQLRRGRDGSVWINQFFDWFGNLFNPEKKKKPKNKRDEFYYNVTGTQPYKKIPNITQKRIDEILDKINQQGYRFLTNEEKEILKRAAEEDDL